MSCDNLPHILQELRTVHCGASCYLFPLRSQRKTREWTSRTHPACVQMRDQGDTLTAYCVDEMHCRHSEVLPIDSLIQRLGWDFDYVADREWLRRHLICTKCGSRNPSLIVAPAVQSGGVGAGHSSGADDSLTIDEIVARDKARKVKAAAR